MTDAQPEDNAPERTREQRLAELAEKLCRSYTYGIGLDETQQTDPQEAGAHWDAAEHLLPWIDEAPKREIREAFGRGYDKGRDRGRASQARHVDQAERVARSAARDASAALTAQLAAETALDATYRERAHLVALLAALHPSHIGRTDPNAPEWAVVTVETPAGQMTWHIAERDMDLFAHVQPTNRICRGWDGHTTEEKYQRMRDLTEVTPCLLGQDDLIERQAEHIKRLTSRVAELEKQAAGD
ncbi:hypothetical protein ACFVYE_32085 [Streptomyces sp. NPDC058239]|uniref:WDGH domain-containing protein n=1 Tax=Streptomyces sp. NPDC058239 TaxID=3346395 RepID=UPI0036E066F6